MIRPQDVVLTFSARDLDNMSWHLQRLANAPLSAEVLHALMAARYLLDSAYTVASGVIRTYGLDASTAVYVTLSGSAARPTLAQAETAD